MSKFGELINDKLPLLLVFYNTEDQVSNSMNPILKDVAAAMGDKGKVIKIDTEKNKLKAQKNVISSDDFNKKFLELEKEVVEYNQIISLQI